MITSRPLSMRMAAAAGSLALAASVVSAPATFALADTPEGAIQCLETGLEALDIEGLKDCFCAEQAETMGGVGLDEMMSEMPPGMDMQTVLDAFVIDVDITSMERLEESDTEVTIGLEGTLTMDIDPEGMGPFIEQLLAATGQEVTDDMVQMMTAMMATQFETEVTDMTSEVLVTNEGDGFGVCSPLGDLGDDGDDMGDGDMGDGDMGDGDDMGDGS